jgi:14-3-3 protein epsilon
LISNQLIVKATSNEAKVFYHKMKGDYYRYISEYTSGAAHDAAGKSAHTAYTDATKIAE